MIISKTPFRISFAGGGSDLPSFYRHEMGAVLSTTIDKYMYIALHPYFDSSKTLLKYSQTELIGDIRLIKHPILRETLIMLEQNGVDINSIADIPSGTGLGSSSAFTVGLLNALYAFQGRIASANYLAEKACYIEIDVLKGPIGKQDQYAAAHGGLNFITFHKDEGVNVEKIIMNPLKKRELEKNLFLFYTGDVRSANAILEKQSKAMADKNKFQIQKSMVNLAFDLKKVIEGNDINDFGRILHEGWQLKKTLSAGISNSSVDDLYNQGINAGALGGKLLGAGGAGFILFYCSSEKQEEFRQKMSAYKELPFRFDNYGSKIIYIGDNNYEL